MISHEGTRDLVIVTITHPADERHRADVIVDVARGCVVKNRFGPHRPNGDQATEAHQCTHSAEHVQRFDLANGYSTLLWCSRCGAATTIHCKDSAPKMFTEWATLVAEWNQPH